MTDFETSIDEGFLNEVPRPDFRMDKRRYDDYWSGAIRAQEWFEKSKFVDAFTIEAQKVKLETQAQAIEKLMGILKHICTCPLAHKGVCRYCKAVKETEELLGD